MQHFTHIGKVDVLPLRLQLGLHPELWDQHTGRTERADSPHAGVSDCWLRWRPLETLRSAENYNEPFSELAWYPAVHALPAARPILMDIMQRVGGTALGGCIITRIKPGGQVKMHSDAASWHAQNYHLKVYVVVTTNDKVTNCCNGETYVPSIGECFSFDNRLPHAVFNEGDDDRWTLMAAIRTE
jgi:hypothetical protein